MIDLNKLDKEKQQVMSNVLKPTVFASSKIKIELQEGYDKNLLRSVVEVLINDTKVIEWNNNNIYGTITCNRSNISKYCMGTPLYRQEKMWDDLGLVLPRNMMANWCIKISQYYLEPLYRLMLDKIKENSSLIHCDETTIQVNKEANKKEIY